MSEQSPFAPFEPQAETPAPEKPKKGRKPKVEAAAQPAPAAEPRQRRKAAADKPSLKFDLQTILAAARELNPDDVALFEKIVGELSEAGKPGRERVLAAIGKIFA